MKVRSRSHIRVGGIQLVEVCVRSLIAQLFLATTGIAETIGSGTISGVFANPTPVCVNPTDTGGGGVQCSGTGTSMLTWGDSTAFVTGPNKVAFSGGSFSNVTQGETFVAGLLYYFNGTTVPGTSIDSVNLVLTSSSATPEFNNQVLNEPILIIRTANTGISLIGDADFIYFPNHPELGSFRVFEGAAASVQILAKFGSLDLVGFGQIVADPNNPDSNPQNGVLLESISAVPEPGSIVLVGIGLGAAVMQRRK